MAAWSVPVAFVLAGLTVLLPAGALAADVGELVGACLGRLHAAYATPAVVVTAGALARFSAPQLAAVLAHERAHLAGRHHRWLTAAALVAQVLPVVPLLRELPARVGRLLEMDADERAAADHEPLVIAGALLAGAGSVPSAAAPSGAGVGVAAGASVSDAAARVRRLLHPPARLTRLRLAAARASVVALTLAPLLLAVAPIAVALV